MNFFPIYNQSSSMTCCHEKVKFYMITKSPDRICILKLLRYARDRSFFSKRLEISNGINFQLVFRNWLFLNVPVSLLICKFWVCKRAIWNKKKAFLGFRRRSIMIGSQWKNQYACFNVSDNIYVTVKYRC